MQFPVRAITLDLDDTLWPFGPIGARVEHVLHDWLMVNCPHTAERFPVMQMRTLREQVDAEHPHLAHDFSRMRKLTLARAMSLSGEDPMRAEEAFEVFFAERNRVECYPDAIAALQRLAARLPLAALTNGNADLNRIGLAAHFRFQLGAGEHGAPKPIASIFHAACTRLQCAPAQVLHVGDDIELDVVGAYRAGLRTCWINREGHAWPYADLAPDLEFTTLTALADWLDASPCMEIAAA